MKYPAVSTLAAMCAVVSATYAAHAEPLPPENQIKVAKIIHDLEKLAADPSLVASVKAQNAHNAAEVPEMSQERWSRLTVLDPIIREYMKNPTAELLRGARTAAISEAFVCDASGMKVAFLSKTSNWSHKGKPKHDVPMSGKTWQGTQEFDSSTGALQIQVAVPVLDNGTPIGSIVAGISLNKL
jgi:hypothetical protein